MKTARLTVWRRLTRVQRVLISHVLILTLALVLGQLQGATWAAASLASLATVWSVARLLKKPSWRTVLVRSLEPLIIIWGGLINLQLIGTYVALDATTTSLVLVGLLFCQARFFLVQFDPGRREAQSLLTLLMMGLLTNAVSFLILAYPSWLAAWLALTWVGHYVVAHFWLERVGFHTSFISAVWALLITQITWISSYMVIMYQLPGLELLVSRLTLMIIVMVYAWGSLLRFHSRRALTKKLVVEYGMVCAFVVALLIFLPAR